MFDQEPQDIFAGTDNAPQKPAAAPSAAVRASVIPPRPVAPAPQPQPVQPVYTPPPQQAVREAPRSHVFRNLILTFFILLVVGVGAYAAYAFVLKPMFTVPGVSLPTETDTSVPEEEPVLEDETPADEPVDAVPEEDSTVLTPSFLDSDGDGLTNAEELEAGTSSTNADTDGDGLGDKEEVKVYGTDPRRTDTDNDSYLDGAEVEGGYNPNGPGKLLEIPTP